MQRPVLSSLVWCPRNSLQKRLLTSFLTCMNIGLARGTKIGSVPCERVASDRLPYPSAPPRPLPSAALTPPRARTKQGRAARPVHVVVLALDLEAPDLRLIPFSTPAASTSFLM